MAGNTSLRGKVTLITGGSSGIGKASAIHFASCGAKLVLFGRNEGRLKEAKALCEGATDVLTVSGDITVEADVQRLVNTTIEYYHQLDILINNVGIFETGSIEKTSLEQYDRLMNVNVRSMYHLTMLAVPHLISTKGAIVNLSSIVGIRALPNVLAAGISKATVDQFTKCLALELAPKHVRVNCVNPGLILTEMIRRGKTEEEYLKYIQKFGNTNPLGQFGQREDVAKAIAFLASSDSSFTTGSQLPVDGGRHLHCPR